MKVTLTPEPNTERTDMTEEISADLALADAEARESRERERFETEAWLIRLSDGTRFIHGHNAIGDYRAIDPGATVVELVPRAALAPAVPPGFVLVPVEPTPEMREAGHKAWMKSTLAALEADPGPEVDGPRSNLAAAYRSMCAAAPSAKEPGIE